MNPSRLAPLRRALDMDLHLCVRCNRLADIAALRRFFARISRLGDGVFWYTLILLLPMLYGTDAIAVSIQMAATGVIGLIIYKLLKGHTLRERPYQVTPAIRLGTAPLDHFSFPSGHTLHAISFSTVAVTHYPELAWVLAPFTVLVMASRVVLGLHYPSDVAAGALIGWAIAHLSFYFIQS
jgi:undecaprenyl-diphosphatase